MLFVFGTVGDAGLLQRRSVTVEPLGRRSALGRAAYAQSGRGSAIAWDLPRGAASRLALRQRVPPRYVVGPDELDAAWRAGWARNSGMPFSLEQPFVDFVRPETPTTAMGWIIEPRGLQDLLQSLGDCHPDLPLYISENGMACDDYLDPNGTVRDTERIDYLDGHRRAVAAAIHRGVHVRGYFLWSFLDNFEWAEGLIARNRPR